LDERKINRRQLRIIEYHIDHDGTDELYVAPLVRVPELEFDEESSVLSSNLHHPTRFVEVLSEDRSFGDPEL